MDLFDRLLSSPRDYPLPPLVIKKVEETFYHQKPKRRSLRMVFYMDDPIETYNRKHQPTEDGSNKKNTSRKVEYIRLPTLRKPTLAAIGFIKISPHLLGLYKRAEERQRMRDALRNRRVPVRKKRIKSKIATPEDIEIEEVDVVKNVVLVN